ncbi:MAG: hypothetical protein HYV35_07040 [Lentisphaerae bacterium]|nr:hypothetical protein [Lentisphaerota bacterium]
MPEWNIVKSSSLCLVIGAILGIVPAGQALVCAWNGSSGDWFDGSKWTNGVPSNGDDVVIGSGVVYLTNETATLGSYTQNGGGLIFSNWMTKLTATNVYLNGGSNTTPAAFTTSQMSNRVWIACTNLFIATGARIDVNGKGYAKAGTGYGPGGGGNRAGGGYGGRGGNYAAVGGATYGSTNAPTEPGSGGGGTSGGDGGGAVLIEAPGGSVTVSGTIRANGANGAANDGGGSGGSIYITCRTLSGTNGLISAAGGSVAGNAGCGGGGRIAIIYDSAAQSNVTGLLIQISAAGETSGSYPADLGTLYFPDNQLLISPFIHSGQWAAPGAANFSFDTLTVSNGWVRFFQDGTSITVTNNLMVVGSAGRVEIGANTYMANGSYLDGTYNLLLFYNAGAVPPALNVGGNLILTNGGKLYMYSIQTNDSYPSYGARVSVTNDLLIYASSRLYPVSHPTNGGSVFFTMSNLVIASNAAIDANSLGYAPGSQSGSNPGFGPGKGAARAGAGYGGFGGNFGNGGGLTYGSTNTPLDPGSGGGTFPGQPGGGGGGLVRVQASQTITINGAISANGYSSGANNSGSGSGGGINLICDLLSGSNGTVSVDGGTTTGGAGNGGGGRIAIIYNPASQATNPLPAIRFSARGGTGGSYPADLGTLYFPDNRLLGETIPHSGQWLAPTNNFAVSTLAVTGAWFRFAIEGMQIRVTNDLLVSGSSARLDLGGANFLANGYFKEYSLNQRFLFSQGTLRLDCGGNLFLTNSASLYVFSGFTNQTTTNNYGALVQVGSNLVVANACWIYPVSNPTNGGSVFLHVGSLTISTNAGINADDGGYVGMSINSAAGFGPGSAGSRGGGGYGGTGGYTGPGNPYGNSNAPAQCGSGGGNFSTSAGGTGGGLAWIQADSTVAVDGRISANGTSVGAANNGSGSGGGIYIRTRSFTGTTNGLLRAVGGASTVATGGGGGGGRIAVWRMYHSYPGAYSVTNGSGGNPQATEGTLVLGTLPMPGSIMTFH